MQPPKARSAADKAEKFRVSLLPMTSLDDVTANLNSIQKAQEKLKGLTQLLLLPENSLFLNLNGKPIPADKAFDRKSPAIQQLQESTARTKLPLHLGGIPWRKDGHVYNEALFINAKGEVQETYEKIHRFDVNLGPGLEVMESRTFSAGERLNVIDVDGWRFATCICYDLRFAELFLEYQLKWDVDAFLVPAAFTTKTGEAHWKPLLHARAIETQRYVLAPAQVGYHRNPVEQTLRKTWGQTLAISPWGDILAETPDYRDFLDLSQPQHEPIQVEMVRSQIEDYRRSIPVEQHRRFHLNLVRI